MIWKVTCSLCSHSKFHCTVPDFVSGIGHSTSYVAHVPRAKTSGWFRRYVEDLAPVSGCWHSSFDCTSVYRHLQYRRCVLDVRIL